MTGAPMLRYRCAECGWTVEQSPPPPRWCSSCGHDGFTVSQHVPPPPPDQEAA